MKITRFDANSAASFHSEFDSRLRALAAEFGLKYVPGNGKYAPATFKLKGSFVVTETLTGEKFDLEATEYRLHCLAYGMKIEWLSQSFTSQNGIKLTVKGWDTRQRKNKVILADAGGKQYKASPEYVKLYMNK